MSERYAMTIGGDLAPGNRALAVENPATRERVGEAPDASQADLDHAVSAARAAFPGWSAIPVSDRKAAILALADAIETNLESLKHLLTAEQGKPLKDAEREVRGAASWLKATADFDLPVTVNEDSAVRYSKTHHVPHGVVAAIAPWNYPLLLAAFKLGPALLTGNTVVLKPSPFTPLTSLKIGALAQDILPPGVLNVVSGSDDLGPWLTSHSGIDKISFTGSTAVGKLIMQSAAQRLTRITLELGGNDAALIMPDADPAALAEKLFAAALTNAGQICLASKRLYIHADIYDAVRDALYAFAQTVKVGNGAEADTQMGPVNNARQLSRVRALVADSQARGHRMLRCGAVPDTGYFHPILLIDNPPEDRRIVQEEQFGPLVPLIKVASMDDAVTRANASPYGLGASIWGEDETQAWVLAARLEAGTVCINEARHLSPKTSFAGMKQSGYGVENGLAGVLEFTCPKTITYLRA